MAVTHAAVEAGFEQVERLFAAAAADPGYDAQLSVLVDGRPVVDLAAGIAPDALMTVYSSSKGLAAAALMVLADRGLLDPDERVAAIWPEFAAAGKGAVTVRQLLSHQAGLPEVDGRIPEETWFDDHEAAALLAAQRPFWAPGAAFGYHGLTIGPLVSELCFRLTGETVQAFYEREVRVPAGADAWLGLPADLEHRVVPLAPMADPTPEEAARFAAELAAPRGPYGAFVFGGPDVLTTARGRAFGNPAGGGVASARGLAAVYAWAARTISPETIGAFAQAQVAGYDVVLDQPYRSHGLVYQKPTPAMPFGSYRAFGHDGAGGAMAFADPQTGVALGYTVRRTPFPGGMDRRLVDVIAAVTRAIRGAEGPR